MLKRWYFRLVLRWLNFIHNREWLKWERKYLIYINGKKNYSMWPKCHKATPEWKKRVQRVKRMCELAKRIKK